MIYGDPPFHVDDDQTDKIGIRTLVMSKLWQPSRWPLSMLELANETPEPPEMAAGLLLVGRQTRKQGGALRTQWTFEGVDGDGKSVTFRTRANTIDFGFDPGFAQVSIQLHPQFQELLEKFGGSVLDAEVIWPPTVAGGGSNRSGLSTNTGNSQGGGSVASLGLGAGQGTEEKPNPMYGITEFLRHEGTYHCRYAATSMGGPSTAGVGQIHRSGSLPGEAPSFPGRDWLKAPPPYRRRGPVFDITEVYWLSGPGGWPKPVYGTASQR